MVILKEYTFEEVSQMAKAQTRASNKYAAKAYDRIALQVKKGRRDELRMHAEQRGESLNGFINRAIENQIEQDRKGGLPT